MKSCVTADLERL